MSWFLSTEFSEQINLTNKEFEEKTLEDIDVISEYEPEIDLTELTEKLSELSHKDLARLLSKVVKDKELEIPKVVKTKMILTQPPEVNHEKGIEFGLKGVQLLTFSLSTFKINLNVVIDEKGHTTVTHLNDIELKLPVKI